MLNISARRGCCLLPTRQQRGKGRLRGPWRTVDGLKPAGGYRFLEDAGVVAVEFAPHPPSAPTSPTIFCGEFVLSGMQPRLSRALLTCAALVLLLGAGADDELERIMPDVEVR